jgi:hypothetical protein
MPSETPIHSKLLTAAARAVLRPLGLFQKGRSRTWLDDHNWWVCVVEFQPNSWARGSYLNVGCMWLWTEKDYLSFDEGYRVESFSGFDDESRFEMEALRLAQRAAEQVQHYRRLFPNVHAVCEYYLKFPPENPEGWQNFHAGLACAMADKPKEARRFFDLFLDSHGDRPEWLVRAQADAEQLMTLTEDLVLLHRVIGDRVKRARALQKLPLISTVNFKRDASSAG